MRKLVLGVLVGFLAAASAAFAFDVTFPSRLRVQAHALVDELGNVLLGSTPAKIEVTNLPSCGGEPELFSAVVNYPAVASANVLTVPAGKRFVLTDVVIGETSDGTAYQMSDSGGIRLFFAKGAAGYNYVQNYNSGVAFGPGETLVLTREDGNPLYVRATFMGRLVPAL